MSDELNLEQAAEFDLTLPRVDPARGVFITSEGAEIALRPIRALVLERIFNDQHGKPQVPVVTVMRAGHEATEPWPEQPEYIEALRIWNEENGRRILRFLYTAGVQGTPPADFVAEYRELIPGVSDLELKYLWVASVVPDGDVEAFTAAVAGQSIPTVEGMQQAADSFRRAS